MKITLKKGSVAAPPGGEAGVAPAVEPAADAPIEASDPDAAPVDLPPALADGVGAAPAVSRRKGIDLFGIIFAVVGFLAIAVFIALLILQSGEISHYKAPDSLWLK